MGLAVGCCVPEATAASRLSPPKGLSSPSVRACRPQRHGSPQPCRIQPQPVPSCTLSARPLQRGGSRRLSCRASDASLSSEDSFQEAPKVFPRIGVRDPYKRLGLTRDASTEEITEAKNYLAAEYLGHERSREAIEEAFDKIIFEKFRERKKTKINLKADLKKKVAQAPPWVQALLGMVEAPKREVVLQRAALFLLLAAWSVMNPAEGGPAFQVAVGLGLSIYLINDRLKSIGRAFLLGFGALITGWIVGSFIVPFIPELTFVGGFWSLELGTALVAYIFLWFATTFLK